MPIPDVALACRGRRASRRQAAPLLAALALLASVAAASAQERPAAEPEIVYTAQPGDTLIGIGNRLLAQPRDWRQVARINRILDPDRIQPAQPIRIPLRLLRGQPAPATVLEAVGNARAHGANDDSSPLAAGSQVAEGSRVLTGADGYVTLRLADGSLLRVQAASETELAQARALGVQAQGGHRTLLALLRGRIEVLVTQVTGGAPRFEVRTPQAVVGVRGTEFRVSTADGVTLSEVLDGRVAVGAASAAATQREQAVAAGFGVRSDGRGVETPRALLPAPAVDALPAHVERTLVRMPLPPVDGAVGYRVQVALDPEFRRVAAEGVFALPELRFNTLEDDRYWLRVRAIDSSGLEGREAVHAFQLKARPEPPLTTAPAPRARLPVPRVEFGWAAHPQALHYRLQLARTPDFATIERTVEPLTATSLALDGLTAGTWHWRLATVRRVQRDGRSVDDAGPWGDPQSFELRALPPLPAPPRVDAVSVRVAWGGEPGQHFDFQLARDAAFSAVVLERQLDAPQIVFERPPPGTYYLRYRAIDADGYVGPFIAAQQLALHACVRDTSGQCISSGGDTLRAP